MGALHEGHASLIRRARRVAGAGGSVVVSIFVNPTQFGPAEDLSAYPRPLGDDLRLCAHLGVDLVFAPLAKEMYAPDASVVVEENRLSLPLCGQSRPGHFSGVCTIVAKLFNLFLPQAAVFGEKDWQQLAVIRRMVRDLNFPVRIVAQATSRESDGLARSSRNVYLTAGEREAAPQIYAALKRASGQKGSAAAAEARARKALAKIPGVRIDYLKAIDAATLGPPRPGHPARLAAAVYLGRTRLIDNVAWRPVPSPR